MRVAVYTERDTRRDGNRDNKLVGGGGNTTSEAGMQTETGAVTATGAATIVTGAAATETATATGMQTTGTETAAPRDVEVQDVEWIDMANGWIVGGIGWLIWAFLAGLNVYLIVMLALGRE
jgi:hypothetical protein